MSNTRRAEKVVFVTNPSTLSVLVYADVEIIDDLYVSKNPQGNALSVAKPFWHLTLNEACAHADRLRKAKIKSLEKQLAKLRSMTIEVHEVK